MHFVPAIDSPMVIVTCFDQDRPSGCLVGFSTQCSIDPPRFLVCISRANHTFEAARACEVIAVHLLTANEKDLARRFGEYSADATDKFSTVAWHRGRAGTPVLDGAPAHFEARVLAEIPVGDHSAFVIEPLDELDAERDLPSAQLRLRDVMDLDAGHPA
jgi:flavin reductase (DIM6/NTAB) family NADH-FMN oxidoreductase RutF